MECQIDLLEDQMREDRIQDQIAWWKSAFDWDGPTPGGLCEVDSCVVDTEDGDSIYACGEMVTLIEQKPDGRWLAEMKPADDDEPWPYAEDSYRLVLDVLDIAPPRELIRKQNLKHLLEQCPE